MGRNEYDTGKRNRNAVLQKSKEAKKGPDNRNTDNMNTEFACALDSLVKPKGKKKEKENKQDEK